MLNKTGLLVRYVTSCIVLCTIAGGSYNTSSSFQGYPPRNDYQPEGGYQGMNNGFGGGGYESGSGSYGGNKRGGPRGGGA